MHEILYHIVENFQTVHFAKPRKLNPGNTCTLVLRKRALGWCTLHWAQSGGWADIPAINIVYYHRYTGEEGIRNNSNNLIHDIRISPALCTTATWYI